MGRPPASAPRHGQSLRSRRPVCDGSPRPSPFVTPRGRGPQGRRGWGRAALHGRPRPRSGRWALARVDRSSIAQHEPGRRPDLSRARQAIAPGFVGARPATSAVWTLGSGAGRPVLHRPARAWSEARLESGAASHRPQVRRCADGHVRGLDLGLWHGRSAGRPQADPERRTPWGQSPAQPLRSPRAWCRRAQSPRLCLATAPRATCRSPLRGRACALRAGAAVRASGDGSREGLVPRAGCGAAPRGPRQ